MTLLSRLATALAPRPADVQTPSGPGWLLGIDPASGSVRVRLADGRYPNEPHCWHPAELHASEGADPRVDHQLADARQRAARVEQQRPARTAAATR